MIKFITDKYTADTYSRYDVELKTGKGSVLYDVEGKKYIDFGSGIAVNVLGVCNKKWVKAVTEQTNLLCHTSNLYYNIPSAELSEKLCKMTNMKRVFLCNSGAEANECAIKTARKYSSDKYGEGRYEIVTLNNSFHGRTMATLSATGQESFHKDFAPFVDGFVYTQANNCDSLKQAVNEKTCAIMMELVQGEGGVNPLSQEFVDFVVKICAERDILLIIDEVQTGNGRCGALYAYMLYGIKPDIVTTAKGLGGGLPIGACIFGEKTSETLSKGTHGSTFGANPIVCAGAKAILEQLTPKLMKKVAENNMLIRTKLAACKNVKSVSGLGLMIGIECDDASKIVKKCIDKGLLVLTAKNKIRLLPALNIPIKELEEGLNILTEVIDE